jgi:hypothetical protein
VRDEGPSEDDIERFSRDTAYCPDCGAEVWDAAEVCPECHAYIGGNTRSRSPLQHWFQQKWMVLIVILLFIAFLLLSI